MNKISKRFEKLKSLIEDNKLYSYDDAIKLVQTMGTTKFLESVEAHISLNIDPKFTNQQLRTHLNLPNGTGKQIRIAVLTESESSSELIKNGASIVGFEDLLEEISKGILNFDILLTTPQYMPRLAKFGKILGPKGLMPSPKSGTVTTNLKDAIGEFKGGKVEYRADKTGIVHLNFGKLNFSEIQLKENLLAVYNSINKNKPIGVKGKYFKSFYICSTMSPSIQIDLASFKI
jgi:large subunit ribosomal protein L1